MWTRPGATIDQYARYGFNPRACARRDRRKGRNPPVWTRPVPPGLTVDGQLDAKAKNDDYQNQESAMSLHRVLPSRMPARTPLTGIRLLAQNATYSRGLPTRRSSCSIATRIRTARMFRRCRAVYQASTTSRLAAISSSPSRREIETSRLTSSSIARSGLRRRCAVTARRRRLR